MIIKTKCPICSFEGKIQVKIFVNNMKYLVCPSCLVEFISPIIPQNKIKETYEKYYKYWDADNNIATIVKRATFVAYIEQLKLYRNSGKFLDIGAGRGEFLDVAYDANFDIFGIELSEYASRLAKNKFGSDKIHTGTIETANFPQEYFDIITICDVLEHTNNPVNLLKKAYGLLKRDGYIMITTPNYNSFIAYFFKLRRTEYQFEHLYYFQDKTIEKIFLLAGFKVIFKKSVKKVITIKYLNLCFNQYNMYPLNYIFAILDLIPFINTFKLKLPSGNFQYILKKKDV